MQRVPSKVALNDRDRPIFATSVRSTRDTILPYGDLASGRAAREVGRLAPSSNKQTKATLEQCRLLLLRTCCALEQAHRVMQRAQAHLSRQDITYYTDRSHAL